MAFIEKRMRIVGEKDKALALAQIRAEGFPEHLGMIKYPAHIIRKHEIHSRILVEILNQSNSFNSTPRYTASTYGSLCNQRQFSQPNGNMLHPEPFS
jgi:hypothetical protein